MLTEQPFTVQTRWERVYDSARSYALVFFADGEELSEKLVKAGLCRIHTKGTWMPDGRREIDFENHLRVLDIFAFGAFAAFDQPHGIKPGIGIPLQPTRRP